MLFLDPLNRIQVRGELLQPNFLITGRDIGNGRNTNFCHIQGLVEKLHRMLEGKFGLGLRLEAGRNYREAAQRMLDEFLEYLGDHLLVQLICYENLPTSAQTGVCPVMRLHSRKLDIFHRSIFAPTHLEEAD
jgi:hypothetical protein